ncbi:hypothetical protein ACTFIW_011412 [Dictyostelium discoideum]
MSNKEEVENEQNTFCLIHSKQEITFICTSCKFSPACNKCVVLKGIHFGHDIIEIDDESVLPILKEMNEKTIPKIDELIKNNQDLLKGNLTKYEEIKEKHKSNLQIISGQIKKLHTILQTVENNLNQQLTTNLDENTDINDVFNTKVKEELKVLSKVISLKNDYSFIDESQNLNNKHIQIIKDSYQSKKILTCHFSDLPDYSLSKVTISESSISSIKDLFNSIISIDKYYGQLPPTNENSSLPPPKYRWGKFIFTIYNDGDSMPDDTESLAIGEGQRLPKTMPKYTKRLLLPNGFNQSLMSLPKTVRSLYIFNIGFQLAEGSIPETVDTLFFCDGFSQKITKGIIPKSVKEVFFYNISQPPEKDSIPNTVSFVGRSPSFKHPLDVKSINTINDRGLYIIQNE